MAVNSGKELGKTWAKAFENMPRLVVRSLQFIFALIAVGFYGHLVDKDKKADHGIAPEWLFAVVVVGMSCITAVVFLALGLLATFAGRMRPYRMFAWDLILGILWIIMFGLFAGIFLKRTDEDKYKGANTKAMKVAVWIDLVNAILWLVSGAYGWVKVIAGEKVDGVGNWVLNKLPWPLGNRKKAHQNNPKAYYEDV
ncbi:uncharacterized protein BCR38DRAFT_349346 [Pseudomassariella vexata]|uniref:MARVEL domain-containing protein n=1 Tax=Pseudomassariella vexata TaxID=1141098 RepID=A0A1Y2DNF2_9PEZI|nr:uncharacterized protein BCR38DRAFT_349346 [Pseudomassariella vexata]ORY60802.1 hypothetical protein BCR38DRAFT_349346 [Pseudomassariella vexata]